MTQNLDRLARGFLVAFLIVVLTLGYWASLGPATILRRSENPRLIEAEQALQRGMIVDKDEVVLARSVQIGRSVSGQPRMRRDNPYPEAASVVGYYSLTYGVSGAEASFDDVLRGQRSPWEAWVHQPQVGGDVRLTIDAPLQREVASAFGRNIGAIVVLDVPTGAVRALYSSPSFDPNALDETYPLLRLNPFAPLVNRATQGIYQPGGALQPIALAVLLRDGQGLDALQPDSAQDLKVNGLTLRCATTPRTPTVIDTFAAACPRPFVDAFSRLPLPADSLIRAFGLLEAPTLTKFGTVTGKNPTALASLNIPARRLAQASGQGDLTVTPLQMALLAATIANDGTTITPYLVDAIRPADMPWQAQDRVKDQQAVITRETAQQLRLAMRAAVDYGSARAAQPATPASGAEVYGHASIAYTGINSNAWFIGFTFRPDGSAVAVAVVVEGKADTALASQIGGAALQAARK